MLLLLLKDLQIPQVLWFSAVQTSWGNYIIEWFRPNMAEQFIIQNHHANRHPTLHKMSGCRKNRKDASMLYSWGIWWAIGSEHSWGRGFYVLKLCFNEIFRRYRVLRGGLKQVAISSWNILKLDEISTGIITMCYLYIHFGSTGTSCMFRVFVCTTHFWIWRYNATHVLKIGEWLESAIQRCVDNVTASPSSHWGHGKGVHKVSFDGFQPFNRKLGLHTVGIFWKMTCLWIKVRHIVPADHVWLWHLMTYTWRCYCWKGNVMLAMVGAKWWQHISLLPNASEWIRWQLWILGFIETFWLARAFVEVATCGREGPWNLSWDFTYQST